MNIRKLKASTEDSLLAQDHVHAVGIGLDDGNEVLVVTVEPGTVESTSLPQGLDEEAVVYKESPGFSAEIRTLPLQAEDRKAKHRPVMPGVSTGHPNVSAGTVGFKMTDGNHIYAASNNHVYADMNRAEIGDPLYQPGSYDGGQDEDRSATLAGFVEVHTGVSVDLAWGKTTVEHTNTLVGVGAPRGRPRDPSPGDTLIKSGRTTGVTTGEVEQVQVSVDVDFGGVVYRLTDQILTEDMSEPGDSGSAALHVETHEPAGLLFAGSETATVFNTATNVEEVSGLEIVTGLDVGVPTVGVQFTLEREDETGNLSVVVYGEGGALSDATVAIDGPTSGSSLTDEHGEVLFPNVPIDDYTITAHMDGYQSESVEISAEEFR